MTEQGQLARQFGHRQATMADAVLVVGIEFGGGAPQLRQQEVRVVAEAVEPRGTSTISPCQRPSAISGSGSSALRSATSTQV
jgi:hypothetical protein